MASDGSLPEDGARRRALRCRACSGNVKPGARYCPSCGAYQNPVVDRRRRARRSLKRWRAVRGTVVFYSVYLATIMPLFWVPEESQATAMLVVSVVDAAVIMAYWHLSSTSLRPTLQLTRPAVTWTAVGAVALVPLLAVNFVFHGMVVEWLGIDEPIRITDDFSSAGYDMWVAILAICVMPAFWEEIAFRGLIQSGISRAVGGREAMVVTAILFAIIHRNPISGPYLFLVGLVLGYARRRSGSLVPGMAIHFLHNLAVVVVEYHPSLERLLDP